MQRSGRFPVALGFALALTAGRHSGSTPRSAGALVLTNATDACSLLTVDQQDRSKEAALAQAVLAQAVLKAL